MAVVLTDIQIAFAAGALFADAGAPVMEAARKEVWLRYPAPVQVCDYAHFKADPYALPCRYYIAHKPFFHNFMILLLLARLPLLFGFVQVRLSVKKLFRSS